MALPIIPFGPFEGHVAYPEFIDDNEQYFRWVLVKQFIYKYPDFKNYLLDHFETKTYKIPFGLYKNKSVEEISKDEKYFEWLANMCKMFDVLKHEILKFKKNQWETV